MPWNAKELQISKLVEATDLVLPRFQRKSTWNAKKDYLLALSFFRGLPLGTIVIKEADSTGPGGVRYLLDGRQRWEALKGIRDPETLYTWAKAATGLRSSWSESEVTSKVLESIEDYFGTDPSSEEDESPPPETDPDLGVEESPADYVTDSIASATGNAGLDELLSILLLVHPLSARGSRFARAFAFHDLVEGLPYVDTLDDHSKRVNAGKLREWITFRRKISAKSLDDISVDDVVQWVSGGTQLSAAATAALHARIDHEWGTIRAAIRLNHATELRLEQTVIAALVLTGTTASEDAKIFEIINTGGTKLTAAEVLSAAPQWRTDVEHASAQLLADAVDLYAAMGVEEAHGAARWDVPATLLCRLKAPAVLGDLTGPTPRNDTRRFERRITLGFQLLTGWHAGKIAKDHVESLPKTHPTIDWGATTFEDAINSSLKYALGQEHFQYWENWGFTVIGLMSDAVALNFLLLTAVDWDRRGRPTVDGAEMKTYRRNARTLLDRSIFEYCTGQWRGSSDSRIAARIASLRVGEDDAYEPVAAADWERLAHEVLYDGSILGAPYSAALDSRIKLLSCYRTVIRRFWEPPAPGNAYDFDHIIPSSEFASVPAGSPSKSLEHHMANIAVLPRLLNRTKSDDRLNRVGSAADRQRLSELEDVPLDRFDEMSAWNGADSLVDHRRPILLADLTSLREQRLASASG